MTINITINQPQNGSRQVELDTDISLTISSSTSLNLQTLNCSINGLKIIDNGIPQTIANSFILNSSTNINSIQTNEPPLFFIGEHIDICSAITGCMPNQIVSINSNTIKVKQPLNNIYEAVSATITSVVDIFKIQIIDSPYFDPEIIGFYPIVQLSNLSKTKTQTSQILKKEGNILTLKDPIYIEDNIGSDGYYINEYEITPPSTNLDGYITMQPQIQSRSRSYNCLISSSDGYSVDINLSPKINLDNNKLYLVNIEIQDTQKNYKKSLFSFRTQDTQPPQLSGFSHTDDKSLISFDLIDTLGNQISFIDVLINNKYAVQKNVFLNDFFGNINFVDQYKASVQIVNRNKWKDQQKINIAISTSDGYQNSNTIYKQFITSVATKDIELTQAYPAEDTTISPRENNFIFKFKTGTQIPTPDINLKLLIGNQQFDIVKQGLLQNDVFENSNEQILRNSSQELVINLKNIKLFSYNKKFRFNLFLQQTSSSGDFIGEPYYLRFFHYSSLSATENPLIENIYPAAGQKASANTNISCTLFSLIDKDPINTSTLQVVINESLAVQAGLVQNNFTGTITIVQGSLGNTVNLNIKSNTPFEIGSDVRVRIYVEDFAANSSTAEFTFNVVNTNAPIITFNPSGGYFNKITRVSLTTDQEAIIYYTIDGSTPQIGKLNTFSQISPIINLPIYLNGVTIVRAFAQNAFGVNSSIVNEIYDINIFKPEVIILSPINQSTQDQTSIVVTYQISLTRGYLTKVEIVVNNNSPTDVQNTLTDGTTLASGLTTGTNTIKILATDNNGNVGVGQTTVIVNPSALESLKINYAPLYCPTFSFRNIVKTQLFNEFIDTNTVAIIGYGSRSEQLISYATGDGKDGVGVSFRSENLPDGRHFQLKSFPIVPNSLQVFLFRKGRSLQLDPADYVVNLATGQIVLDHPLELGEQLSTSYISNSDINQPELFTSNNLSSLYEKHGTPNKDNSLSLAAQLAFENGATRVVAIQPLPISEDPTWDLAFRALEKQECYWVVPVVSLEDQDFYPAIRAKAFNHVTKMSQIQYRRERVLFASRIGEEINAFNSSRAVLLEVDNQNKAFRLIDNSLEQLHTSFLAAALAGRACSLASIALPLTKKNILGFTIGGKDKSPRLDLENKLFQGFTTLQPLASGGSIFQARTSYIGSSPIYQEPSIQRISDHISKTLRTLLEEQFVGKNIDQQLKFNITNSINQFLNRSLDIISSGSLVQCEVDSVEPRQLNIVIQYNPLYPLNQLSVQINLSTKL